MKIDRRITNGLAWAGVLLVIGVPTADLLSAQFSGDAAATPAPASAQVAMIAPVAPIPAPLSQRPAAPVAQPAAAVAVEKPVVAKPAATQTAGVVDNFLQTGKALPSYITGAGAAQPAPAQVAVAAPVRTPIVTTPVATPATPVAVDPVTVASIGPQKMAPTPMPLSMRPRPVIATTVPEAIVLPPDMVAQPPATVDAADLDDWETGPLSEFLARKQGQRSSATVTTDYDPDGFFLDQGPNPNRNPRNRDRVIGWEDQGLSFFAD